MGVSRTVPQLVGKIGKSATELKAGNPASLRDATQLAERVLDGAIAAMSGGDMAARNLPREGKPSRMRARAGAVRGVEVAHAKVGPKGPVPVLENGSDPHPIGLGRQSRSKGKGIGALGRSYTGAGLEVLVIPNEDIVRPAPFLHPGTAGQGRWKAARESLPALLGPKMIESATRRALGVFL